MAVLAPGPVTQAVSDEDAFGGLLFSHPIPGARAAGMARAGLALVNDPTALRLNPARLAAVDSPAIALDLRWSDADPVEDDSGLVATDPALNPFAGTTASRSLESDDAFRPSFIGYAHPLEGMTRPFVPGVSRTEAMHLSVSGSTRSTSVPVSAPIAPDSGVEATLASDSSMDVSMALWDVGGGWRFSPTFAAGATVVVGTLSLSTRTVGSLADPLQLTGPGTIDPRFGTPVPQPLVETESDGDGTAFAFSFGSWWKPARTLALAVVYRQGPRFDVSGHTRDLVTGEETESDTRLRMPDTAAVGVVWNPKENLTLALDVESASGAELSGDILTPRNIHTAPAAMTRSTFEIDDEIQVRLGMEVRRSMPTWTMAFRGGVYNERSPVVRRDTLEGDVSPLEGHAAALEEAGFFDRPDTEIHATLGFGAAFYALGFDLGVDASESRLAVTASTSWRFGR